MNETYAAPTTKSDTLLVNGRSSSVPFKCNPKLANLVKITLNGAEGFVSPDGDLMFNVGSQAQGAVIAISDDNNFSRGHISMGKPLPKPIQENLNITLFAYVKITSEALANASLVPGPFSASMVYQVEYE